MIRKVLLIIGLTVVIVLVVIAFSLLLILQGPCGSGSFQCSNSSVCIPQKGMCDHEPDCPNGDDEDYSKCVDFHGSTFLIPEWVQILNKSGEEEEHEELTRNRTCVLETYPHKCVCDIDKPYLYCKHLGLRAIPTDLISSKAKLHRLILANNSIQQIGKHAFPAFTNLHLLHLEQNRIMTIPNEVFRKQKKLKYLYLSRNDISLIEPNGFMNLTSLKRLFLDYNEISDSSLVSLNKLPALEWLDLSYNQLRLSNYSFVSYINLRELLLEHNVIEVIDEPTFFNLSSLTYLSLRYNRLKKLHERSFWRLVKLQELDLSWNKLTTLHPQLFAKNKNLSSLSLGHNMIFQLPGQLFQPLVGVRSLHLEDIEIHNANVDMFSSMRVLDFVYFKRFQYCSFVPHVPKCRPNTDGLSSRENLLNRSMIRITIWAISIFTLSGNSLVLLGRGVLKDDNKVPILYIRSLAVADMLMGIYLFVIAIQDLRYREVYHLYSHEWASSLGCTAIGVLAMISTEVSLLLLAFMSMERFLCIASPFGYGKLGPRAARITLVLIWGLGLIMAIVPVLHWRKSTHYYGSSGLCFPLHISEPFSLGWQYSAFIFLGVNSLCVLVVVCTYTGLFISIRHTRCATPLALRDMDFALRFFFIVLVNCLCWAPVYVLRLMVLLKVHVPEELSVWVVVFVVPINAAVDPILYTFTTPKFRLILAQLFGNKCLSKPERHVHRHHVQPRTETPAMIPMLPRHFEHSVITAGTTTTSSEQHPANATEDHYDANYYR